VDNVSQGSSSSTKRTKQKKKSASQPKSAPVVEEDGEGDEEPSADKTTTTDMGAAFRSYLTVEHREFLEDYYPKYLSYEARSKDKSKFLKNTAADVLVHFPLEDYPLPPSQCKPLPPMTKKEVAALPPKPRKNRQNAEKRRERSDEQRFVGVSTYLWRSCDIPTSMPL
jgi:hypothetical protein